MRGKSKEEWLPSETVVGTGDIVGPRLDPEHSEARLVAYLADGKLGTKKALQKFAADVGWSEQYLADRLSIPTIRLRVIAQIRLKALQAVAGAIESQSELAKTDLAAYKVMLQTAEVIQTQGPHLNVAIDARKMGDSVSDRKFFEAYHRRIEGNLMHDPVPEEPPTPEETLVGAEPVEEETVEVLETDDNGEPQIEEKP
jgi:hypothetical protein